MQKKTLIGIAACSIVIIFVTFIFAVKNFIFNDHYDKNFVVGKEPSVIIEEYGQFDKVFYNNDSKDEITSGWYVISERKKAIIGMKEPIYFVIEFENNVAINAYERTGNIGG